MKKHSSMSGKQNLVTPVTKKSNFAEKSLRKGSGSLDTLEVPKLESPATVGRDKKTRNKMTLKSTASIKRSKFALAEDDPDPASFFANDIDLKEGYTIWLEQSEKMSTQISHLQLENEILKRRVKGGTEYTEEEIKKNAIIAEQNEKITELLIENGQLKLKYNCLEKEFEDYQQIIADKIGEDDEELRNEVKQKELKIAEIENLLHSLEKQNKNLIEKYGMLKQEKETAKQSSEELAFLEKSCKEYEERNRDQENKISQLEDDIHLLQENNEELQNQVNEWKIIADKYNQQIENEEKSKSPSPGLDLLSSDSLQGPSKIFDVPVARIDSLQRSIEQMQEQLQENYEYSMNEDRKRREELGSLIQNQTTCQESLLESINYLKSIEQNMSSDRTQGYEGPTEERKPVVIVESLDMGSAEDIRIRQSTEELSPASSDVISKPTCVGSENTQTHARIYHTKSSKIIPPSLCTIQPDYKKEIKLHKIKEFSKHLLLSWESVQLIREAGAVTSSKLNSIFSQL